VVYRRPRTMPTIPATARFCRYTSSRAELALQDRKRIMLNEITKGIDELGVLLAGHQKNAYWYGSQLSIEEARLLAPFHRAKIRSADLERRLSPFHPARRSRFGSPGPNHPDKAPK